MDVAGIEIVGLDAVKRRLSKVEAATKRKTIAYKKAVIVVDGWVQRNFRGEGKLVGGWKPLSDVTIERRTKKRNKTGFIRILQDTGELRRNWKHFFDDDSGSLLSGVDYGLDHDQGGGRIPQRRILPTSAEMWPKIKQIFEQHIEDSFRG